MLAAVVVAAALEAQVLDLAQLPDLAHLVVAARLLDLAQPPDLARRPAAVVALRAVRVALLAVEVVPELLLRLSRQSFSAAMARSTP